MAVIVGPELERVLAGFEDGDQHGRNGDAVLVDNGKVNRMWRRALLRGMLHLARKGRLSAGDRRAEENEQDEKRTLSAVEMRHWDQSAIRGKCLRLGVSIPPLPELQRGETLESNGPNMRRSRTSPMDSRHSFTKPAISHSGKSRPVGRVLFMLSIILDGADSSRPRGRQKQKRS